MTKEDITILVNSCDKYSSAWEPFFRLLKIQWPECTYDIVLSTETKQFSCDYLDVKTINSDSKLSWSSRLINTLNQIDTEYVLFFLEDFFLLEPVAGEKFKNAYKILKDNNSICMIQFPSIECNYIKPIKISENCYEKVSLFEPYRAKVMVSLWRKKDFINLLFENENPWFCEKETSIRSVAYGKKIYRQDHGSSQPVFFYGVNPNLGYGITQGKWLKNNKTFFEKNGIYGVHYDSLGILEEPKSYEQLKAEEISAHHERVKSVLHDKKIKDILHLIKRFIFKKTKVDYGIKFLKYKVFYLFNH